MKSIIEVYNRITLEKVFMLIVILVNSGNYLYNLLMGRLLGPAAYSEVALLITLVLILSFFGMTFQFARVKFSFLFTNSDLDALRQLLYTYALSCGMVIGILLFAFSNKLQQLFNTESDLMFKIFAVSIPMYLFMSVHRDKYQDRQDYNQILIYYQNEMWVRLILTLGFLWLMPNQPVMVVSIGIILSFVFGLIPINFKLKNFPKGNSLLTINKKKVIQFLLITGAYQFTQILINNCDVLLVRHYFDAVDAGLYASLAMIGNTVYFVGWVSVLFLLPSVTKKLKDGEPTAPLLIRYVGYIIFFAIAIISYCAVFPELTIQMMFSDGYLSMAPLLWQYALAASMFAIANIFAYYFLSLGTYFPVLFSGFFGVSQIVIISFFHTTLYIVVQVQIVAMLALLVVQLLYFAHYTILNKAV